MALPKVSTPTYELTIPSSGEKVSYRPFLVKEEKTLLMAMESKDTAAMTKAMQDIITSCTDGEVKPKDLAPYDLEYFFLQLRGRSVGEVIEVNKGGRVGLRGGGIGIQTRGVKLASALNTQTPDHSVYLNEDGYLKGGIKVRS